MSFVTGIIITIIGVILYAVSSMLPPGATTIARIGGIILAIIGIIIIILAAVGVALFIAPF
jgi:multisubunit Na+/H+ antiporter MnhG subunit